MIFMNGRCPSALSSSDSLFSYFYSSRHFRGNWRRAGALNEFTETVLNQKSVMIFQTFFFFFLIKGSKILVSKQPRLASVALANTNKPRCAI